MIEISIKDMFKAKIHFGHIKKFISPRMKEYIHSVNNNLSIINLDLTLKLFINALNFIEKIILNNGSILFVGTKRQASKFIEIYANKINMPYVNNRWLGGLLTNYNTISKSIQRLNNIEVELKKKDVYLTKKEILVLMRKVDKLNLNFNGIRHMSRLPDALFVIDAKYEIISLMEAYKLNIPTICVVDTNSNPDNIDYVIPGNDDSAESIKFYLDIISKHILDIKKRLI